MSKITPGSNQLWEGSRFIIPQHKEAMQQQKLEQSKKSKPELDEQRLEELAHSIGEAMFYDNQTTVIAFGEYDDTYIEGRITRIDPQLKQIKVVQSEDEFVWVKLHDIVNMY